MKYHTLFLSKIGKVIGALRVNCLQTDIIVIKVPNMQLVAVRLTLSEVKQERTLHL